MAHDSAGGSGGYPAFATHSPGHSEPGHAGLLRGTCPQGYTDHRQTIFLYAIGRAPPTRALQSVFSCFSLDERASAREPYET